MPRVVLRVVGAVGIVASVVLIGSLLWPPQPADDRQPDRAIEPSPPIPPAAAAVNAPAMPAVPLQPRADAWLSDQTAQSGIKFVHHSGDSPEKPFPSANGSGLAAFDYDVDGYIDLVFATGNDFPVDEATASHSNRCYRNLGGWAFA